MRKFKLLCLAGLLALAGLDIGNGQAAGYYYRQYYQSSWSYSYANSYYYQRYYYRPVTTVTYNYHYVIYYPSQPRYYYYYNPVKNYYWGRFDIEAKGYSLLKEEDRKEKLSDIPDKAFPRPAAMPGIPEATDGEKMEVPTFSPPKDVK